MESAFIEAEKKYNINSLFLISICALESGWGNSDRAKRTNNLTGYAVYNSLSRGAVPDSKSQSILDTAKLLRDDYVNSGRLTVRKINDKYCTSSDWTEQIIEIGIGLKEKSKLQK